MFRLFVLLFAFATPAVVILAPAAAWADSCSANVNARSRSWDVPVTIRIINETASVKRVAWVNYEGEARDFGKLAPGEAFDQSTFVTHPWRITNEQGDCERVFLPSLNRRRLVLRSDAPVEPAPVPTAAQITERLPGRWRAFDDPRSEIEFVRTTVDEDDATYRIATYDNDLVTLDLAQVGGTCGDDKLTIGNGAEAQCFDVVALDRDALELSLAGRGNTLRYWRLPAGESGVDNAVITALQAGTLDLDAEREFGPGASAELPEYSEDVIDVAVTARGGNLRERPSKDATRSGRLSRGEKVTLTLATPSWLDGYYWFRVARGGTDIGYVWGGILCAPPSAALRGIRRCE